jgi:hypothetical protein
MKSHIMSRLRTFTFGALWLTVFLSAGACSNLKAPLLSLGPKTVYHEVGAKESCVNPPKLTAYADGNAIFLARIDGKRFQAEGKKADEIEAIPLFSYELFLKPGLRTVAFLYQENIGRRYSPRPSMLILDAKPGHSYRVKQVFTQDEWHPEIVEVDPK